MKRISASFSIVYLLFINLHAQDAKSFLRCYANTISCNSTYIDTAFVRIKPDSSMLFYSFNYERSIFEKYPNSIKIAIKNDLKMPWTQGVLGVYQFKFMHRNVPHIYHKNAYMEEWVLKDSVTAKAYFNVLRVSMSAGNRYATHLKEFQTIWLSGRRIFIIKIGDENYMIDMKIMENEIKAIERAFKRFMISEHDE